MKCSDVRVLLAAYRRGEWTPEDQRQVNAHLMQCVECRRWEAQARGVGDVLRQMPTMIPPESFRDRVFAAIRREEIARATEAAEATPSATPKSRPVPIKTPLPVKAPARVAALERVGEIALGRMRPPRVYFGRTTAIATIAALFLIMFVARLDPFNGAPVTVQPPGSQLAINPPKAGPITFQADSHYSQVTSVFATLQQIIYTGQNAAGETMLFAQDRAANTPAKILPQPNVTPIVVLAVTNAQVIIQTGTNAAWAIEVIPLTNGVLVPLTGSPLTIVATSDQKVGATLLTAIKEVWANDAHVLFTALDARGTLELVRVTLANGVVTDTTVLAEAQPGHTLTMPFLDGDTAYWVDQSLANDGQSQGVIWEQSGANPATALINAGDAFGPDAASGHVAWFRLLQIASIGHSALIPAPIGTLIEQSSATATPHIVTASFISATSVYRGQGYYFWQDASGSHVFLLSDETTKSLSAPAMPSLIELSPTSIAWTSAPPANSASTATVITVYDV